VYAQAVTSAYIDEHLRIVHGCNYGCQLGGYRLYARLKTIRELSISLSLSFSASGRHGVRILHPRLAAAIIQIWRVVNRRSIRLERASTSDGTFEESSYPLSSPFPSRIQYPIYRILPRSETVRYRFTRTALFLAANCCRVTGNCRKSEIRRSERYRALTRKRKDVVKPF